MRILANYNRKMIIFENPIDFLKSFVKMKPGFCDWANPGIDTTTISAWNRLDAGMHWHRDFAAEKERLPKGILFVPVVVVGLHPDRIRIRLAVNVRVREVTRPWDHRRV
jgi:hypothetical protein